MPTGKTVGAIILKFLSGIHILLKVYCFEGLVNQSNITDFMVSKTSRYNFQLEVDITLNKWSYVSRMTRC